LSHDTRGNLRNFHRKAPHKHRPSNRSFRKRIRLSSAAFILLARKSPQTTGGTFLKQYRHPSRRSARPRSRHPRKPLFPRRGNQFPNRLRKGIGLKTENLASLRRDSKRTASRLDLKDPTARREPSAAIPPTAAGAMPPAVSPIKAALLTRARIIRDRTIRAVRVPTGADTREAKAAIKVLRAARAAIRVPRAAPVAIGPNPSPMIPTGLDPRAIRAPAAIRASAPINPRAAAIRASAPTKGHPRAATRVRDPIPQAKGAPIPEGRGPRDRELPADIVQAILPRADPAEGRATFRAGHARELMGPEDPRAAPLRWRPEEPVSASRAPEKRAPSSAGRIWSWRRSFS